MSEWVVVARTDDVPVGQAIEYDHRGEPVCVARTSAGLFAFDGWCSHEECPLWEGTLTDTEIECYCHGSFFDMRTGEALVGPAVESIETYAVREQDGDIQVELP
jgi:3-phenylpropionate/trans-cinnamate dioxygenase ferredoxin subunit